MHLQEKTLYDLDLGGQDQTPRSKVTQNVAQYPLHHVTYASAKFEVKQFRRRCIYKKIHYLTFDLDYTKHRPVPSTLCDLCICKVYSCYIQWFRRRYNYKKPDRRTDTWTDRLWYKIHMPYFRNENAGIL